MESTSSPAGTMFDSQLVPTYLALQAQQAQQQAQQAQHHSQQAQQPAPAAAEDREDSPPPAKRRRRQRGRAAWQRAGDEAAEAVGTQKEAEEGAQEERRGAEEHLSELTLGFARDCFLAPWLRRLLQQPREADPPGLAERVWRMALSWTELEAWKPRLEAACSAAGLAPPQHRHEWLPLATGWCVVFEASWAGRR